MVPIAKLTKTIFEVRFRPNIEYYRLWPEAAAGLAEFPHWQTDGKSVLLYDTEDRCSLAVHHNRVGFEQDGDNIDNEASRTESLLSVLSTKLKIDKVLRMGFRRKYLAGVELEFESLVKLLDFKLFSTAPELRRVLPEEMTDSVFRVDMSTSELKFLITIAPVRKKEIADCLQVNQIHFSPETRTEDLQRLEASYPAAAVFFDIDVYKSSEEPIQLSLAKEFHEQARKRIEELVSGILRYVFHAGL